MNIFPPLPAWNAMHPLVVHFPIALLLVAPLFVLAALAWRRRAAGLIGVAATLMTLGAASALLATATGSAAEDAAESVSAAKAVLERHEEGAELARNLAIGAAAVSVVVAVVAARSTTPPRPAVHVITCGVLLLVVAAPALVVANAAHEGGRLVHEFGVRAPIAAGATPAAAATPPMGGPAKSHDDD